MRVAIVENTKVTHHGQVGVALHEQGALIDLHRPFAGQPLPDPGGIDALVVFGGEQSALADDTHPYLPTLAALMRDMTTRDKPVLGICLGAQILARAFGGTNSLGTAPEFGWCDITLTDAGRADPFTAGMGPCAFQWHSDTFTLPPGAVPLAHSSVPQAFRIARATYGTQFHFEASRAVVADWTRRFPALCDSMQPGWTADHPTLAAQRGAQADATGLTLARNWVSLIHRNVAR
jgi:GMP synthase (glutamine-hydrolysing)